MGDYSGAGRPEEFAQPSQLNTRIHHEVLRGFADIGASTRRASCLIRDNMSPEPGS
jgi:hypothetical protein